jgi:acetyl-CoA carboxylase biotin carboxylase subunit
MKCNRVLIANRGEIAIRIMRTLQELNLESVAIYSEADELSQHRSFADFAIALEGRTSAETYLDIDKVIQAAKVSKADAIHPGYGFLSENAEFAKRVKEAGLVFIGPSAEAMQQMGDKICAKHLMISKGLAVVPGSDGGVDDEKQLMQVIDTIGLPVIIKATAGGGGRGMRIVRAKEDASEAYHSCRREALSSFANDQVFVEKYIEKPRHIEVQILCDGKNGVHLFERDCSIQRRHQKLLEEAPSLYLSDTQREHLGQLAVKAALEVGYEGAGTVEFICESPDKAYFMEMNTRIQVEHPVTEMITGIDIVAEQINIATGKGLSITQDDVSINGWSMEARINAEDVRQDFMPAPGRVGAIHWPLGFGVRVDTHIYPGYDIPADYDSMIAKLIVWGRSRQAAIQKLKRCLAELNIADIATSSSFHEAILSHPDFVNGDFSTRFLEENADLLDDGNSADARSETCKNIDAICAGFVAQMRPGRPSLHGDNREVWQSISRREAHRAH